LTTVAHDIGHAFGYLTQAEITCLQGLAESLPKDAIVINIGAGAGTSGLAFACARSDIHIITIDISSGGSLGGLENERNAFDGKGFQLPEQILGDSVKIGKAWKRGKVNIVFIDGDHTENGVRRDIEAWIDHILPGGIIIFHDYDSVYWGAIKDVVDVIFQKDKAIALIDTLIAFRVNEATKK